MGGSTSARLEDPIEQYCEEEEGDEVEDLVAMPEGRLDDYWRKTYVSCKHYEPSEGP